MWLADDSKFSSQFRYIELARYVSQRGKVSRESGIFTWADVPAYRERYANVGIYTSVFQYNDTDLTKATRLGSLYFDCDSEDGGLTAQRDARQLVDRLLTVVPAAAVRIYFTGKKGFHIEAEALAMGIDPSNDLPARFRVIAQGLRQELELTTLDFSVYDLRRMWRIPNSRHQETDLYKVEVDVDQLHGTMDAIKAYASAPRPQHRVPAQEFSATGYEWYRGWEYRKVQRGLTLQERIDLFNRRGTSLVIENPDSELVFDSGSLWRNCPAFGRHVVAAVRDHDLPHEARLFLCSLLSYTPDAERYLHEVLAYCDDYSYDKTEAYLRDWVRRRANEQGGHPYSCDRANQAGIGCGDCALEPKERRYRHEGKIISTGELSAPSPVRFAYSRKRKGYQHGKEAGGVSSPQSREHEEGEGGYSESSF